MAASLLGKSAGVVGWLGRGLENGPPGRINGRLWGGIVGGGPSAGMSREGCFQKLNHLLLRS